MEVKLVIYLYFIGFNGGTISRTNSTVRSCLQNVLNTEKLYLNVDMYKCSLVGYSTLPYRQFLSIGRNRIYCFSLPFIPASHPIKLSNSTDAKPASIVNIFKPV